eukprot:CAMPEP_0114624856 /NCGR_PEP_ID=MMETSP0168-20121206/10976_1 /TAXON_ID=95228 ORGANISM="Vannella sp., Strain DIVA3 517/6/12" /NCGR_SAMPLE_ID=MMETSP0168 /ASSEMBLY_ACC=CAM_ASM_000044 /LENGTH=1044 /DNA_ID=CAMNT_0001836131 /DNA_START=81 /DNA_END=3215 /DNA_ORIENTATION=+
MAGLRENVVRAFQFVLSPNDAERKTGEQALKELQSMPGYLSVLFELCANEGDFHLRQQAGVQMKNALIDMWAPKRYDRDADKYIAMASKISAEERDVIRSNLVNAMIAAPPRIRLLFGVMMKVIVDADFPEQFPALMPHVVQLLNTQDYNSIYTALYVLHILAKKYEYKEMGKGREPLLAIVAETFPRLIELFNGLVLNDSLESATAMTMICKTFFTVTHLEMPPMLMNQQWLIPWMNNIVRLFTCPIPAGEPADIDERPNWPWWKAKKWSIQVFTRMFANYAQPADEDVPEQVRFSHQFMEMYACKILEAVLAVLSTVSGGNGYLPERVKTLSLQYLSNGIRFSKTYKVMKTHLQDLLRHVIFPILCFNDLDRQLWERDPQEYIRKEYDVVEEYYSSKKTAENLLFDLFKTRSKSNLTPFMQFIVEVLMRYNTLPAESKNYSEKDGALSVIGTLASKLKRDPAFSGDLQNLIVAHVLPDFQSPAPFIRARVCWCFSLFFDLEMAEPVLMQGIQGVVQCLQDGELPVRVAAAIALRFVLENPFAVKALAPSVGHMLDQFFDLMQKVDNDELIGALETVVEKFEDHIPPYAATVCQRLVVAFVRVSDQSDTNETAALVGLECLKAIQTVLVSIRKNSEAFLPVTQVLLPMIVRSLAPQYLEYFEDILKVTTFLTYFCENPPQDLWQLIPIYLHNVETWAQEYLPHMLPSLDNMISKSKDVFLAGPFPEMYYKMAARCFSTKTPESVQLAACELIECVLQNCPGKVDMWVPGFLELMATRLQSPVKSKGLRVLIFDVFANCLYYNPTLFFAITEKHNWTLAIFKGWFDVLPDLNRVYDRKIMVLGLSAIFAVPQNQLPACMQTLLQPLLVVQLKLMHDAQGIRARRAEYERLQEERSKRRAAQRAAGIQVESSDDDEDLDDDTAFKQELLGDSISQMVVQSVRQSDGIDDADGEVVLSDEDIGVDLDQQEYLEMFARQWVDEGDEDLADDDDVTTPVDDVDEILFFCQRLEEFYGAAQLVAGLSPAEQAALHSLGEQAKNQQQNKQ